MQTASTIHRHDRQDFSRRAFASRTILGTAAAAIGLAWADSEHLVAQAGLTDLDILNFALNVEYLEAEFYTVAKCARRVDPVCSSTLNELAAALFLDKSTTSRTVTRLQQKGYVTRQTHPDDRRAVSIAMTRAGETLYNRIQTDVIDEVCELLRDVEPASRQTVTAPLLRLTSAAEPTTPRASEAIQHRSWRQHRRP